MQSCMTRPSKEETRGGQAGPLALLAGCLLLLQLPPGCASPPECERDSDCELGTYCSAEGRCRKDCVFDIDCPNPGEHCVPGRGRCLPADAGVWDAAPDAKGRDARVDAGRDAASVDASRDAGVDAASGPAPYLTPCSSNLQCASGLCVTDWRTGHRFCTRDCSSAADCALDHACATLSGRRVCLASDVGKPCSGRSDCQVECLENSQTHEAHCTASCQSARDCPAGYGCTSVGNGKYCVRIAERCSVDSDCITGLCLAPYTYPEVFACSALCDSSADCPVGWACQSVQNTLVCTPPTYGTGGLGDSCADNCQSGLCLGGTCTVECGITRQVGQYCPPGFACTVSSGQAGNVLVCASSGSLGFGEPCTGAPQCASEACMQMSDGKSRCTRFCNDGAGCPAGSSCIPISTAASGVTLQVCAW